MQNVPSNFDIDLFSPIMKHISMLSKSGAYSGRVGSADANERDASYRIVADHLRGTIVALADGVVPSAVDSGFIIRKMLRRLFWHAVNRLGIDRFACSDLVPVVIDTLEPVFEVTSVEKVKGVAVLNGNVIGQATISEGSVVKQKINVERRVALMRAHTATHLLNWALRRVGAGRGQRGFAIDEDFLRFDYATDDCAGEEDTVENVESLIKNVVSEARNVMVQQMPFGDAAKIRSLQSEFKEVSSN
ncbi:hypothetical protein TELCIR_15441 [Teladorsagia circumcincta]|uniref:alanine--tRNA ligase n=1 Tax=Teladorsagia circumcincta TaxID=45464 RepID=A0A2G9TY86_TELCI|nr:hypothetical protein TELCIR_15441 [Teladorsagia circumcincta]